MTGDISALFSEQLRRWAANFARKWRLPTAELDIQPPLHLDEAGGMVLALSSNLIQVQADGEFQPAGARPGKGPYNLFARRSGPSLNRSYLMQIAAFAELVLVHRWPARQVVLGYAGLDVVAFDDAGRPVVTAITGRDGAAVDAAIEQVRTTTVVETAAPVTAGHRRVAALARLRPAMLWAVAPGARDTYQVDIDGRRDRLTALRLSPRNALSRGPRDDLDCPVCGSEDDVRGSGRPDRRIALSCGACGHHWSRTPRTTCRRCGSRDVESGAYRGWTEDDAATATDGALAPWHDVDWDVHRCRSCHHIWQTHV